MARAALQCQKKSMENNTLLTSESPCCMLKFASKLSSNDYERLFRDFLDSHAAWTNGKNYKEDVIDAVHSNRQRLLIELNDLRLFSAELANALLTDPFACVLSFESALNEFASEITSFLSSEKNRLRIGFQGAFGSLSRTPRSLSSSCLSSMICIEGIATSCSLVRPKLSRSIHYCENTELFYSKKYADNTTLAAEAVPTLGFSYPTDDGKGNKLTTEFGLSSYTDHQIVSLQEMPESAPPGQLPRSIDVILENDLADTVRPGNRVCVVGIYKALVPTNTSSVSFFRTVIIANNIREIEEKKKHVCTEKDVERIKKMAKKNNILSVLSTALAPSIYGHEHIKKAILLMLLGGVEKNLANGTHIRGDINIMLVGDPSTAKSQLLRFVLHIAPLAIATTGRGSSGVGLTAAVIADKETGDKRLEAGAMVLADRGIICIDEFDKMGDVDRVAIHEVMEQQTVTIAKAGIHVSLNARCSVLAAANPVWGQYRETKPPRENINLPDSLLSRFDLLFIVLDSSDTETDKRVSEHVLRMHQHIPQGLSIGEPIDFGQRADIQEKEESFDQDGVLQTSFVKKYIQYAKEEAPVLKKEVVAELVKHYAELRQENSALQEGKRFPVTPRTLETLIRLSTAHAKLRLSETVGLADVDVAKDLLEFCLCNKTKNQTQEQSCETQSTREASQSQDIVRDASSQSQLTTQLTSTVQEHETQILQQPEEKRNIVISVLNRIRNSQGEQDTIKASLLMQELLQENVSQDVAECVLEELSKENRIMYRNGDIHFI